MIHQKARGAAPNLNRIAARPRPFVLEMSPILITVAVVALLSGVGIGWLLGRARGKRDLAFYKAGVENTLNGRYCWVRSQLPPDQN